MFFSAPPVVDFVDLKDNQVVFLSRKPLRLGRDTPVRLALQSDGNARLIPLRVYLHQSRPLEGGQLAYVGTLQSELPSDALPKAALESSALRRDDRLDCSLRVMSPDLPGYSAISVDVSASGIQLETRSALQPGQVVRLRLETHIAELEFIEVRARVAWCRQENQKAHRAGLEFRDLTADSRLQLEELARFHRRRSEANLTQLVLECADRYLLGYPMPGQEPVAAN